MTDLARRARPRRKGSRLLTAGGEGAALRATVVGIDTAPASGYIDAVESRIHATAAVASTAQIGKGTTIWNWAQVRERAVVGESCTLAKGVYVDADVTIGDGCKIQNNASLFRGTSLGNYVFIGPHVCFTNDLRPRATTPLGHPLATDQWECIPTRVDDGASIGANATVRCGVRVGAWSMVAAGAVVTHDVEAYTLVQGVPARPVARLCRCGSVTDTAVGRPCSGCATRGLQW